MLTTYAIMRANAARKAAKAKNAEQKPVVNEETKPEVKETKPEVKETKPEVKETKPEPKADVKAEKTEKTDKKEPLRDA